MLFAPEQILVSLKEQLVHLTYIAGTSKIACWLQFCIYCCKHVLKESQTSESRRKQLYLKWDIYTVNEIETSTLCRYCMSRYLLNWCPWFDVGVFKEKEWLIWGNNSGSLISRLFIKGNVLCRSEFLTIWQRTFLVWIIPLRDFKHLPPTCYNNVLKVASLYDLRSYILAPDGLWEINTVKWFQII